MCSAVILGDTRISIVNAIMSLGTINSKCEEMVDRDISDPSVFDCCPTG